MPLSLYTPPPLRLVVESPESVSLVKVTSPSLKTPPPCEDESPESVSLGQRGGALVEDSAAVLSPLSHLSRVSLVNVMVPSLKTPPPSSVDESPESVSLVKVAVPSLSTAPPCRPSHFDGKPVDGHDPGSNGEYSVGVCPIGEGQACARPVEGDGIAARHADRVVLVVGAGGDVDGHRSVNQALCRRNTLLDGRTRIRRVGAGRGRGPTARDVEGGGIVVADAGPVTIIAVVVMSAMTTASFPRSARR